MYQSVNAAGEVQYVGITNNFARRAAQHLRSTGIQIERIPGLDNLTRVEARAVEQVLILRYGLQKTGGSLMNRINSIAESRPDFGALLRRGVDILNRAGH